MCVLFYYFFHRHRRRHEQQDREPTTDTANGWKVNERSETHADWLIHNKRLRCEPYSVYRERIGHTHTHTETYMRACSYWKRNASARTCRQLQKRTHTEHIRTLMSEWRERAAAETQCQVACTSESEQAVGWPAGRHLCQIKEPFKCACTREWESTQIHICRLPFANVEQT